MGKQADIHTKLPDNTTGAITPKVLRDAFDILDPDNIGTAGPAGPKGATGAKGPAGAKGDKGDTPTNLDRPTVVSAYTATPTKAELITAAEKLPHYTNDVAFWGVEHDFYVKDDPQTKMLLVKYRGVSTNTDKTKSGLFFFEKLTKAK